MLCLICSEYTPDGYTFIAKAALLGIVMYIVIFYALWYLINFIFDLFSFPSESSTDIEAQKGKSLGKPVAANNKALKPSLSKKQVGQTQVTGVTKSSTTSSQLPLGKPSASNPNLVPIPTTSTKTLPTATVKPPAHSSGLHGPQKQSKVSPAPTARKEPSVAASKGSTATGKTDKTRAASAK